MSGMFLWWSTCDKNVIYVKVLFLYYFIHDMLEGSSCVLQTKRHSQEFECSKWSFCRSFGYVSWIHCDLMVSLNQVQFGDCIKKFLQLVYCRRRWQVFSLNPFTYAYRPDNVKQIAGIRLDNILFQDVIQPLANSYSMWLNSAFAALNFSTERQWGCENTRGPVVSIWCFMEWVGLLTTKFRLVNSRQEVW